MAIYGALKKLSGACCTAYCCCSIVAAILAIILGSIINPVKIPVVVEYTVDEIYNDSSYYNEVCWLTTHNSYAHPIPSESALNAALHLNLMPNQVLTIKEQLLYGVRSFMIDLHYDKQKNIIIAHEGVLFKQDPILFFQTIKEWLDNNPKSIITIHLESYVENYSKIFELLKKNTKSVHNKKSETMLEDYLLDLKPESRWPKLGEMRKTGKRLVIFSDKKSDVGYGIMHTDRYMETDYNLKRSPSCEMRMDNRAVKADLFVMNHFYALTVKLPIQDVPYSVILDEKFPYTDNPPINTPNDYNRIISRACECFGTTKKWPNFIAVDFVGIPVGKGELRAVMDVNSKKIDCSSLPNQKSFEPETKQTEL